MATNAKPSAVGGELVVNATGEPRDLAGWVDQPLETGVATEAPNVDQRGMRRHRTLKAGRLQFANGGTMDCVIADLSRGGAKLRLTHPTAIDRTFTLHIVSDKVHMRCERTWQRGAFVGAKWRAETA